MIDTALDLWKDVPKSLAMLNTSRTPLRVVALYSMPKSFGSHFKLIYQVN